MSKEHPGMKSIVERGLHAAAAHENVRPSERRIRARRTALEKARHEAMQEGDVAMHAAEVAEGEMKIAAERKQREAENTLSVIGMVQELGDVEHSSPEQQFKHLVERYHDMADVMRDGPTIDQQQRIRMVREKIDKLLPRIAKEEVKHDTTLADPELYRKSLERRLHEIEENESEYEDYASELIERDLLTEKLRLLDAKMKSEMVVPAAEVNRKEKIKALKKSIAETRRDLEKKIEQREALNIYNPFHWGKIRRLNDDIASIDHSIEEQEAMHNALNSAPRRSKVEMAVPLPASDMEAFDQDLSDELEPEENLAADVPMAAK